VKLTDGTTMATETLVWTAGVAASPLVRGLGERIHGRVVVGADLRLPGWDGVFALGDCAAVPDLAKQRDGVEGASARRPRSTRCGRGRSPRTT
jgi:NADH dehydrogenase